MAILGEPDHTRLNEQRKARPLDMTLEINPELKINASRVTGEHLCVVIDDFLRNPDKAVEYACSRADEFIQQERAYPGLVLPVENHLLMAINRFVRREMSRLFGFSRSGLDFHTQYSLATLQPEEFTWIQRLCHTDPKLGPDRRNFAGILYLFLQPEMGGTGFYRWKEPHFWAELAELQRKDPNAALAVVREKFRMFSEAPRYMTESNEAAELLDMVPARFNRFVFYPGDLPHSAFITDPTLLSGNPASGRLTLNFFVNALPAN